MVILVLDLYIVPPHSSMPSFSDNFETSHVPECTQVELLEHNRAFGDIFSRILVCECVDNTKLTRIGNFTSAIFHWPSLQCIEARFAFPSQEKRVF